eukprot:1090309-Pyramimonas_sp.AAC.1
MGNVAAESSRARRRARMPKLPSAHWVSRGFHDQGRQKMKHPWFCDIILQSVCPRALANSSGTHIL